MRRARVYRNEELIGYLVEENRGSYIYKYDNTWLIDINKPFYPLEVNSRLQLLNSSENRV